MTEFEGIVGNNKFGVADGSSDTIRIAKTGEFTISHTHGEHYEAVSRGNVYTACTVVAGVTTGSTSLATTASFTLHNPIGSGVNLSLITASMGYLSGTLGVGTVYLTTHAGIQTAGPTAGTAITVRNALLGNASAGKALAYTTSTTATQIAIRPVWSFGAGLATTVYQTMVLKDYINGEIIVSPGYGVNLHSVSTAGSTDRVLYGMTWEEVPIS